jgi:hypothetical protein
MAASCRSSISSTEKGSLASDAIDRSTSTGSGDLMAGGREKGKNEGREEDEENREQQHQRNGEAI